MTTTDTDEGCECDESPLPGVTNSIPDENGIVVNIERCDMCCRFEGDLEAALVVQFIHGGRIFYYQEGETDPEDPEAGIHEFTGDAEGICIAYATDPWIIGARPFQPERTTMTQPTTGFTVTITILTDDIPDLMAYGRQLHIAEDGTADEVTTPELAAREVAWLFAHEGTNALIRRTGVYAEINEVAATAFATP